MIDIKKSEKVAEILLKIHAIKLQPYDFFTWSSGKKSPIYCDNRVILSYVKERNSIRDMMCETITNNFNNINYIAGVATGAIAHGMMIADKLNHPFIYVRSTPKSHGRQNQIEGELRKNSNVLVIEDLISTGKSSATAIKAIENTGSKVIGLISIFTYGLLKQSLINTPCISLCDYKTLINVAIKRSIINEQEKNILFEWQNDHN